METDENIARRGPVIWADYEAKLECLDILFRFVGYAFGAEGLSEAKRKGFLKLLKSNAASSDNEKLERLRARSEKEPVIREFLDSSNEDIQKKNQQKLKNNFRSGNPKQYTEWVTDGMVSAEILFRITILEDFLKHAHAVILIDDTKLLTRVCPDRSSTNEEIFSGSYEQFKDRQICREVDELDRRGMRQRIVYFKKNLGIDAGKNCNELIEISKIRNNIAHRNPLAVITKDDTALPLENIQRTVAKIIRNAMHTVFVQGMVKYRSGFRLKK